MSVSSNNVEDPWTDAIIFPAFVHPHPCPSPQNGRGGAPIEKKPGAFTCTGLLGHHASGDQRIKIIFFDSTNDPACTRYTYVPLARPVASNGTV